MADQAPWEKPSLPAPEPEAASSAPWERPASAPQGQWGPVSEAANAVLMGAGPTLTGAGAYLRGDDYGAAKRAAQQAQAAYEVQNPKMATGASVVGGAVPAIAMTAMGIPPVFAGSIQGAGPGTFSGDPGQAILGALTGAGGTAAFQGLGRALMGIGRATGFVAKAAPTAAAVPTSAQTLAEGGQQFGALRDSGAQFDQANVRGTAANLAGKWNAAGMTDLPGQASTAHGLAGRMGELGAPPVTSTVFDEGGHMTPFSQTTPATPVGIAELDAMRKAFGNVRPSGSISMTDATAARGGANAILDMYAQNPQIAALSADARGNYGAGLTARGLEDAGEAAANGAQNTGIGMNVGNKFRQAAGAAIKSDEYDHQPDVRAALQATNDGTAFQNLMRRTGTALGGGGGPLSTLMAMSAPAAAAAGGFAGTGSPWGALLAAVPPVVGHVAKSYDNNTAKAAFDNAIQTALKRSPLYAENVRNFVPPTAGIGSQIGRVLAPSIGAAISSPGLGALFGN